MNIQPPLFDKVTVYGRVKVGVVGYVIHMTVDVIVHPTGSDGVKYFVVLACNGFVIHGLVGCLVDIESILLADLAGVVHQ